jgi:hypothetical protein
MVTKLPFAALQKIEKVGSVLPLAAFAHETNVKPEGEWRQCRTKRYFAAVVPMSALCNQERWLLVTIDDGNTLKDLAQDR